MIVREPKLFHAQDSRRNNIAHLTWNHQCDCPSAKTMGLALDLNINDENINRHNSTSLLWNKNNKNKNLQTAKKLNSRHRR